MKKLSALYKDAAAMEFEKLIGVMLSRKWKRAQIAKRIGVGRSAITMALKRTTGPEKATLELLRILIRETGQGDAPLKKTSLAEKLEFLKRNAPANYAAASAAVDALHEQTLNSTGADSGTRYSGGMSLDKEMAEAMGDDGGSVPGAMPPAPGQVEKSSATDRRSRPPRSSSHNPKT